MRWVQRPGYTRRTRRTPWSPLLGVKSVLVLWNTSTYHPISGLRSGHPVWYAVYHPQVHLQCQQNHIHRQPRCQRLPSRKIGLLWSAQSRTSEVGRNNVLSTGFCATCDIFTRISSAFGKGVEMLSFDRRNPSAATSATWALGAFAIASGDTLGAPTGRNGIYNR